MRGCRCPMTALVGLIDDIKAAKASGKSDADSKAAFYLPTPRGQ